MKIFVLLPRIPYPLEKGDKLRAFNHVKHLSESNEIILCALNDTKIDKQNAFQAVQPYVSSVTFIDRSWFCRFVNLIKAFFNGKPLQLGYFYSKKAKKKIRRIIDENQPDHLFCQLVRTAEYIKDLDIPKTIDYQDVFSKGVERRIHTASFILKPFLRMEYRRLLKYEHMIFDHFDHKVIISKPDRDLIPHPKKENIHIIMNGVDTGFFKPVERPKDYDLVFTGNMAYPPNVNAVEYIAKKILPLIRKHKPDIRILISGATPDKRVRAVESKNIHVGGWVDDIRDSYARAKIFIAPMQIGTGLQNKLLEAMAMKIPCITSSLANKALEAKPMQDILIGNDPCDYADHIVSLLEDRNFANAIAENGYAFVHRHYNWQSQTDKLEQIIKSGS